MFIDRIGIHLGFLVIHFYGIIIMLGVVVAALLSYQRAKKYGQDPEKLWDLLTWVLVFGIIGARLWHILTPSPSLVANGITTYYYLTHPLDAIAIWRGGLGILGAVIGGAVALFIFTRRNKLNFGTWVDIIAPGLALAQAIGRWGNFVNQELYGAPTNLPWKLYIDPPFRVPGFENVAYYHPLFLYESLWNLMNAGVLLWIGKRLADRLKTGDIFLVYMIIYPVGRFLLEFLRLDASTVGGININQWIMAAIAVIAVIALVVRHSMRRGSPQEEHPTIPADEITDQQ
jgi:phosphatidylglycerol---prolipoprotein diacylglyceryl transferase